MPTPQSQNYQEIWNGVLKKYPLYDSILVKQDINDNLRMIMARRTWSGLVTYGMLSVPATYTTGTVAATRNSPVITGAATAWPYLDVVDTTLSITTIVTGIIDVTPASMTNIEAGRWLTIDGGNAGEEAVFVVSIDSDAGTFRAQFRKTHSSGVTIRCGSMAGRQFRINSATPFMTCIGFASATRMILDFNWPISSVSAQSYEITLVFASFGRDVKEMLTMVNQDRQYQFDVNSQKALIDAIDPRRAVSSMPYRLAYHAPDPGGAPLYEMWPRPTSEAAYPYFYIKQWNPMSEDNDLLPQGIRSDVLVKLGCAEATRWPGHKNKEGGIYYDPKLGEILMAEAQREIDFMKNEDDSTAIMQLVYTYKKFRFGGPGPDYYNNDDQSWEV